MHGGVGGGGREASPYPDRRDRRCLAQRRRGSQAAPSAEARSRAAYRRHQGGGQHRPDTGNVHQPLAGRVLPRQGQDLLVQGGDGLVDRAPLRPQALEQLAQGGAELLGTVLQERRQRLLERAPAALDRQPALEQEAPDLVDQRGAHADQPVARLVQRLHVELRRRLDRHGRERRSRPSAAAAPPHRSPRRRSGRSCAS